MLRFVETFDHLQCAGIDDIVLYQALGYSGLSGGAMGKSYPYGTYPRFRVVPGMGQRATPALELADLGGFTLPYVQRDCNRLVFGIAIGPPLPFVGDGEYVGWNDQPGFTVKFRYGADVNFGITCKFNTIASLLVTMWTGIDGSGYPAITVTEYIPVPNAFVDYTFIELSVDVTDYSNGSAKVAVNGGTYIEKTGIITAAYLNFGDNPADPRSKLNNVAVTMLHIDHSTSYCIDSMYLCDDAAGYQDDFLGPVLAKSLFPVADGAKHNWTPYENSTVVPNGENAACVDDAPLALGNEVTYVEADQDLVDDLLIYDSDDFPDECTVLAVNHRSAFRNVASPGTPPPNAIVPIYQALGNPVVVTNSLAKKADGWAYAFLDAYYGLVPAFAIPWTKVLLGQSEFGYLLRSPEWMGVSLDEISWDDWSNSWGVFDLTLMEDMGMADELNDNTTGTDVWVADVIIEDGFDVTEEPDDGNFLLDDTFDIVDSVDVLVKRLVDICIDGVASSVPDGVGGNDADHAFDGDPNTWWVTPESPTYPVYLEYHLAQMVSAIPADYTFTCYTGNPAYWPTHWKFEAALGDGDWVTLDERDLPDTSGQTYSVSGDVAYDKFRLNIAGCTYRLYVASMQVFTRETLEP